MKKTGTKIIQLMLALFLMVNAMTGMCFADGILTGDGSAENPYQIGTNEELLEFAAIVTGGDYDACAVVTSNIELEVFNSIGAYIPTTETNPYTGTFDGCGYTIELATGGIGGNKGLFAYTENATFKNLVLTGFSAGTADTAGSVCAVAKGGTFENVISCAEINSNGQSSKNYGGLIGNVTGAITMENCVFAGEIIVGKWAPNPGGLFGGGENLENKITNCYVTGDITGGDIACGLGQFGTFTNCYFSGNIYDAFALCTTTTGNRENVYYCGDSVLEGQVSTDKRGTAVSRGQIESGYLAYLLGDAFGQTIGEDTHPVFATETNKVYADTSVSGSYYNEGNLSGTAENPYIIGDKTAFAEFKNIVTTTNPAACAMLIADLELDWIGSDGAHINTTADAPYTGTFDGNGHNIKLDLSGTTGSKGLFAYTKNATFKNISLTGTVAGTSHNMGSVCAVAEGGTFKNIISSATVKNAAVDTYSPKNLGGLIGSVTSAITMENCAFTGNIINGAYTEHNSGLFGGNANLENVVTNCYVTGNISGGNVACGLGQYGTFTNCYFGGSISGAFICTTTYGTKNNVYYNSDSTYTALVNVSYQGTAVNATQLASGEIAYALGDAYGQLIGTDAMPVFANESNKVYGEVSGNYYNSSNPCGTTENPYKIGSKKAFTDFANLVVGGDTDACAILIADITLDWAGQNMAHINTTADAPYTGTFDGNGHKITLEMSGPGGNKGLFAYTKNATFKNLVLTGNAIGSGDNIGSVCGVADGGVFQNIVSDAAVKVATGYTKSNYGGLIGNVTSAITMNNCAFTGVVQNGDYASNQGGLFGGNANVENKITNCYVTGDITGGNVAFGLGAYGTFTNCYFSGNLSGAFICTTTYGTKNNVYYNGNKTIEAISSTNYQGTAVTDEDITSGKLAYLLGDAFGQEIGTDTLPVFVTDDNVVYTNGTTFANSAFDRAYIYSDAQGIEIIHDETTSAKLIVAVYETDAGILDHVEVIKDVELVSGELYEDVLPVIGEGQSVKIFLWNSLTDIKPLGNFTEISL